ncbi:MAG: class I SAM-dependent methyltransferase [bacterium]
MNDTVEVLDKAGEEYWTKVWKHTELPSPINIHSNNINEYPYKVLHKFYLDIFKDNETKGKLLLEIGCGNSVFMSYFAKEFGFKVAGLDYSELGCEQSKRILQRDGLKGEIYYSDFFSPPTKLLSKFDVVCSFGVVEHFDDTSRVLEIFSRFLKPGGILITSVPNLVGVTGFLQKKMNKPVYDIHVAMNKTNLEKAIEQAHLKLLKSKYFLSVSFAVTLEGKKGKIPFYSFKKFFLKTIRYGSKIIWLFENIFGSLPERKLLSGGIITAAKKT